MQYYRLYFISPWNGHIERFCEFDAPDDESAIELAEAQTCAQPMELWSKERAVRRFEPDQQLVAIA